MAHDRGLWTRRSDPTSKDKVMETYPQPGSLGAGSVIVDIGGDIGAAVVRMSAELTGQELEIRRSNTPWDGTHTGIRTDGNDGGVAIFGSLPTGDYELRIKGTSARPHALRVEGAAITHLSWPTVARGSRS